MSIDTQAFINTLKRAYLCTGEKHCGAEIWRTFCFNHGFLSTFNGESAFLAVYQAGFDGLVNAELFFNLLRKCDDQCSITMKGTQVVLQSGQFSVNVPVQDHRRFPDVCPSQYRYIPAPSNVLDAIKTLLSLRSDDSKFTAIQFESQYLYGLDGTGSRCTRIALTEPIGASFALPIGSAGTLTKLGSPERLIINNTQFGAKYADAVFLSNGSNSRIPWKSIDEMVAAARIKCVLVEFPSLVERAIDRVSLVASKSGIVMSAANNILKFSVEEATFKAEEQVPWGHQHKFSVRIQPQHFLQALSLTRTVNIASVLSSEPRWLHFKTDSIDHFVALMA